MIPTIQNETDAGKAIAANTDAKKPIKIANFQLSAEMVNKG